MKSSLKKLIALVGMTVLAVSSLHAQDSGALIDALVKKGVLTDQEGEEIRADLTKEYATTSAGKLNVSSHITQLKLYGDGRLRYEYTSTEGQNAGTNNAHNWRARYRIRVGADYVFTDNFKAGFELESGTDNDSANQSFGNGFGKSSINVGLIYLQYKPWDFVTLTGGKQKNPLYTTDLVWDSDINPEGAAEVFSWNVSDDFTIGLTAAQFNYAENTDSASLTTGNDKMQDSWIYAAQVPMSYKFSKDVKVTFAPGFMTETGNNLSTVQTGSPKSIGTLSATNINIITAPGDVSFKLFNQKAKFYWDLAYNASGESRMHQVYGFTNAQSKDLADDVAWLAGFQLGDSKKKGDWLVGIDFRQIGMGAVDPNLSDSDFAGGNLNQQGIKLRTGYNFTDFVQGNITYFNTWNYKENLAQGNVSNLNASSTLQLDLVWKF